MLVCMMVALLQKMHSDAVITHVKVEEMVLAYR